MLSKHDLEHAIVPFINIFYIPISFFTHYFMKATNTLRFLNRPKLTILYDF